MDIIRMLQLSGVVVDTIKSDRLRLLESETNLIDLFEALTLVRSGDMLAVVSTDKGRAGSSETFKFKDLLKSNGFKFDGNDKRWKISVDEFEKAKSIISQANKAEFLIAKIEDLEQEVAAAPSEHGKSELMAKINGYVDMLAKETDEKAISTEIQRYLNFFANFHQYSFNNRFLIYIQRPDATRVASYDKWREKNRTVKKGSKGKGIKIMVPIFSKYSQDLPDEEKRPVSYKMGNVFDVSDTEPLNAEGEIPEAPEWWGDNEPSETADQLYTYVKDAASSEGINVTNDVAQGGEKGYSSGGHINITSDVQGVGRVSTMVHEYAHELMHWKESSKFYAGDDVKKDKALKELQAESVSYIVLKHYDIPVEHHTTYLALWKANGQEIKKNIELLSRVAHHIINQIDKQAGKSDPDSALKVESITEEMVRLMG